jgi:hypothetical protein
MNDEPQNYEQKKGDLKFEALSSTVLIPKGSVAGWQLAPMGRDCEQHAAKVSTKPRLRRPGKSEKLILKPREKHWNRFLPWHLWLATCDLNLEPKP